MLPPLYVLRILLQKKFASKDFAAIYPSGIVQTSDELHWQPKIWKLANSYTIRTRWGLDRSPYIRNTIFGLKFIQGTGIIIDLVYKVTELHWVTYYATVQAGSSTITHQNLALQFGSSHWHVLPVVTDTNHSLKLSISMRTFVAGGSHQTSVNEDDNHPSFLFCKRMVTCKSTACRPCTYLFGWLACFGHNLASFYVTCGWLVFSLQGY
jgi:hypothetical protein